MTTKIYLVLNKINFKNTNKNYPPLLILITKEQNKGLLNFFFKKYILWKNCFYKRNDEIEIIDDVIAIFANFDKDKIAEYVSEYSFDFWSIDWEICSNVLLYN